MRPSALLTTSLLALCLCGVPAVSAWSAPAVSPTATAPQAPPDEMKPPDDPTEDSEPSLMSKTASTNPAAQKLYETGVEQLQQNDSREASASFQDALKLDANSPELWYQLSVAQAQDGKYEDGKKSIERAIRLNAKESQYHYSLAIIDLKSKDPNHAIIELRETCKLAPKEANPWFTLASVYEDKEDRRHAIDAYKTYLRLAPDGQMAGQAAHRARQLQVQDDIEEQRKRNPTGI